MKEKSIFGQMDEFGPEKVFCVSDPKTGMKGVLVIDNTARGPGKGGCRMSPHITVEEMCRLARVMTWKWALIDISLGGAKAGIVGDPHSPQKEEIIRSFIRALKEYIPAHYVFGLDMGLKEKDAAIVADECDDLGASMGTPAELGGLPLDELGVAGYGVAECAELAVRNVGLETQNISVGIQGFGAVGEAAARYLAEKGAVITSISTIKGTITDPGGLDIRRLSELSREFGDDVVAEYGLEVKPPGAVLSADVDLLIPAACQDVITGDNASAVKARVIVEGANMPTTPAGEEILRQKGVLILPDFLANAGGTIAASVGMDMRYSCRRPETQEAFDLISSKIRQNTALVLDRAASEKITTREAAYKTARERVVKAMQLRGNKRIQL